MITDYKTMFSYVQKFVRVMELYRKTCDELWPSGLNFLVPLFSLFRLTVIPRQSPSLPLLTQL